MTTLLEYVVTRHRESYPEAPALAFYVTPRRSFLEAYAYARETSEIVQAMTSAPADLPTGGITDVEWFLSNDRNSGFGITSAGELVAVFSTVKGRGDVLVTTAVQEGAISLDCFDGYLPTLYARHGFVETFRESNWTPGGPDVVFMAHESTWRPWS